MVEFGVDPDVIVVGAGHNGLVCAAYLARAGLNVLLVEARSSVGGCASTVEAVGGRVNICNCDHLAVRTLPLIEELDLARHGLSYLDLDLTMVAQSYSAQLPGAAERPFLQFHDVERTLASLRVSLPDQAEGYRRFVHAALPVARLVTDLAAHPAGPRGALSTLTGRRRAGLATWTGRPGAGLATLLRWSRLSAAQVLRQFFTSETILGAAVAGGPAVWGVSPHTPGTGLGALRLVLPHAVQPGRPLGGSGALTDALRASFEAAGGTVATDTRVARLLVEGHRVVGVRTTTGQAWRAKAVVVACDPRAAILEWLQQPPSGVGSFVEQWRARPDPLGYESKLDATITELPRYRQLDERLLAAVGVSATEAVGATNFITPSLDAIASAHRALQRHQMVEHPILLANIASVGDPSMLSPSGAHVLSLEVLFTPYGLAGGWPGSPEPRRWLELYAAQTQSEGDFLARVQQWRAMTPDRYEAEFFMPRGYAQSFAGGPLAALVGRDPELTRYRTPIDGLFLTGAATFPGAGVWGASGRNAAGVVVDSLDVTGRAVRR